MPYTLENSTTSQFRAMLLELLKSMTENRKRREQIEMMAHDFELMLEGRHKEFKTRSEYYSRQLVISDPAKALSQIVSIAETQKTVSKDENGNTIENYPVIDLSFASEEMYNSISDEKLRENVRSAIEYIDGQIPCDAVWNKIYALYCGNDPITKEHEAEQSALKLAILNAPVQKESVSEKDSDAEAKQAEEGDRNSRDALLKKLRAEAPVFDEKKQVRLEELSLKNPTELSRDEHVELSDLKHAKEIHDILDHPDEITVSEEELSNLYMFTKTGRSMPFVENTISADMVFEQYLKDNVHFKNNAERKLHENMQQSSIDRSTAVGKKDGSPSLLNEAARELDFTSKIKVAERGVELAFQETSTAILEGATQKNQSINLYEKSSIGKKLKDLSVLKKEASFLRKTITVDVHEQWEKDRAALSVRHVRKNEEVLGGQYNASQPEAEQPVVAAVKPEPEKPAAEVKAETEPAKEAEEGKESVALEETIDDEVFELSKIVTDQQMEETYGIGPRTEAQARDQKMNIAYHMDPTEKQINLAKKLGIAKAETMCRGEISLAIDNHTGKKSFWDGFVPFEKREEYKTAFVTVTDERTGEQKNATLVQTKKGNVIADSENFRKMVDQIHDRVSDALKSYDVGEVEGAGSSTFGTIDYMFKDVAATIDNGNLGAVADIATKTALVAFAASTIKIDNAINGINEFTKGLAETFLDNREVFDQFKKGKQEVLDGALLPDSDLSLVRPVQELKLVSALPDMEMRNEMKPLVEQSFNLLKTIASDDELTKEYCKASMNDLYDDQKSYMDLGLLAVMRNDDELLQKLDRDYRNNFPGEFQNPQESYIDKVKEVAAYFNGDHQHEPVQQETSEPELVQQEPVQERGRELELERSLFDD